MDGLISNFRGGRHTKYDNQMVIIAKGVEDKESAQKVLNKTVTWKTPSGKEIKGKIASTHGNKGALRVIFEKGMPGQSIGKKVTIN